MREERLANPSDIVRCEPAVSVHVALGGGDQPLALEATEPVRADAELAGDGGNAHRIILEAPRR
jgi:hypothetical protein